MSATNYLYLIKMIDDNKIQLATKIDIVDDVVMSEEKICAVLKRYMIPVDMVEVLADIQRFSVKVHPAVKKLVKGPSFLMSAECGENEVKGQQSMSIGERVEALIEDNDTHIGKLSEYLQVDRRQIQRYRQGEAEMGIYKLLKLCEYYGVSADYILGLPRGLSWPRD